jgi:pimeloyl-ACP methyl ester carboxylesterase
VAAAIADARLVVAPDRGHALHRESPIAFRRLLIDQLTAWRSA